VNTGRLARIALLIGALSTLAHAAPPRPAAWTFAVSGDSRNCGDVVMPSIAAAARASAARFYWHLGDLRFIRDFDADYRQLNPKATIYDYLADAWLEAQRNQIEPFGDMPFFLGIGNHEVLAPKNREEFLLTFADWLDAPIIRTQRLRDDPHDHRLRTYYHWLIDGVDFVNLDNASAEQFDAAQLQWLKGVLERDRHDPDIRAVVIGMHEALPDSLAHSHSMDDELIEQSTGRLVYAQLLELHASKPVYLLASHSHYVMEGVFDTPYWREHGGVLPGWIVGSAGAVRYALPADVAPGRLARTHVYGYLLATVRPRGADDRDPIAFEFREVTASEVPAAVSERFGAALVQQCYEQNVQF
jgi:AcrR family transcriptional regulator